jgi:hypothetical protein
MLDDWALEWRVNVPFAILGMSETQRHRDTGK